MNPLYFHQTSVKRIYEQNQFLRLKLREDTLKKQQLKAWINSAVMLSTNKPPVHWSVLLININRMMLTVGKSEIHPIGHLILLYDGK